MNICAKHKISKRKIQNILQKYNISTERISFNNTVFDIIDTEEKAYWLGFLYADGAVGLSNNSVEISLKILDAEHLFKFKSFLKAQGDIHLDFKVGRCRFAVCHEHFKKRLIELGYVPQKSLILKFPTEDQVPSSLIQHFLRGYFDGDGIFSYHTRNACIAVETGMLGTEDFLKNP